MKTRLKNKWVRYKINMRDLNANISTIDFNVNELDIYIKILLNWI